MINWIQKISKNQPRSQGLDDGGANISGPLYDGQSQLFKDNEEVNFNVQENINKNKRYKSRHQNKKMF
jgi:hypothetical protein